MSEHLMGREELIEVMARRLRLKAWAARPDSDWDEPGKIDEDNKQAWRDEARADLSAIEGAGFELVSKTTASPKCGGPHSAGLNVLSRRAYVMSEPHLSGYRVCIGFESGDDAFAFHSAVAKS